MLLSLVVASADNFGKQLAHHFVVEPDLDPEYLKEACQESLRKDTDFHDM